MSKDYDVNNRYILEDKSFVDTKTNECLNFGLKDLSRVVVQLNCMERYLNNAEQQIAELKKQVREKEEEVETKNIINNLYKTTVSLRDNDFKDLVYENNSLKQQLKSQPAEIVEKIRNLAEKDFDFDTCTCCGEDVHDDVVLTKNDFNKILENCLTVKN